jgi:hypothetical protein
MTLIELEGCLKILFAYARAQGATGIEAGARDLYWTISSPDWLAIYEEPKPSVGSFADDEAELSKLLSDPSRACSVDFDRVAHLLRLLSDTLVR